MTQPPDEPSDETPDFLAKPVSPSGAGPAGPPGRDDLSPPTYAGGEPTNPYVAQGGYGAPEPGQAGYQPGQAGYPPAGYGYAPYAPGPGMPGYPFAQPHSGASWSMGLGITSIAGTLLACACYFPIVCALAGPFAIVLGVRARGDMRREPGRYSNEGAATTGIITGILGTVAGLAVLALLLFVIGALFSVGSLGTS